LLLELTGGEVGEGIEVVVNFTGIYSFHGKSGGDDKH
jgi:hypothetical protein